MGKMMKESEKQYWNLIFSLRLYLITLFIMLPEILLSIHLSYVQPFGYIILGLGFLLILKFVLFDPKTDSIRFQKISLVVLSILCSLIILNYFIDFLIHYIHANLIGLTLPIIIIIISAIFFMIVPKKLLLRLNDYLLKKGQHCKDNNKNLKLKSNLFKLISICFLLFSIMVILIPYPLYYQQHDPNKETGTTGIWVGIASNDKTNPSYLPDETMQMLSDANIYFVTTVKRSSLGEELLNWLKRCKDFEIDVHLSMSATAVGIYKFVNLWTIENLTKDIDVIIDWSIENELLGNPISTLVYDMEGLVALTPLEFYMVSEARFKLHEFYEMQDLFNEFNEQVRVDYNLTIQICGDTAQGLDLNDGDDDIISIHGLLSDKNAERSYMIYRKDIFDANYVVDCCRFLNEGDTIIINSWKFEGCKCWQDLECVIEEARLVLGYPEKTLNLEIWRIDNFLYSYGLNGLHEFVGAISELISDWNDILIWHVPPHSILIEIFFPMYTLLDLYAPFIRMIFGIF